MIRGLWNHAGVLYSVDDGFLYSIDSSGLKTQIGALASIGGPVDFDSTLTQLAVNDGTHLYVFNPSLNSFTTVSGYPGGDRISSLDQRINFQFRGTAQFGWTAAGDATSIDPLSFATAESSPTKLVANFVINRELWLFKEDVTEIWDPVGGTTVYSRSTAAIDYGCAAPFSVQRSSNSVFWLGKDRNGQAMVLASRGHDTQRISTRAQEEQFQGLDVSSARAFCYTDGGLSFYVLNVPTLTTTLVFEETFGEWHERSEWVGGVYSQWLPTCHAFAYGKHYLGCGANLCVLDPNSYTNNGNPLIRRRISPVISKPNGRRTAFPAFEVVCDRGTGATLMLRWSDDNGANWSNWHYSAMIPGDFAHRNVFHRLGSAYDRVFDLVMTDPYSFNPALVYPTLS